MAAGKVIALALVALIAAAAVEAQVGSTRYELNGVNYDVPHQYEFTRNFRLPWLEGLKGLDQEPDQSIWLLIPAGELARDIVGYSRTFHGYSSDVEANMVVNVLGGKEAREFPEDRVRSLSQVAEAVATGEGQEADQKTGWKRVYWMRGGGGSIFFLVPSGGLQKLPPDWLPPSCQGSTDANGRETYDCTFVIYRKGLTFDFSLRQENPRLANGIPDYVLARLQKWQR
jgi:hypothetical protein